MCLASRFVPDIYFVQLYIFCTIVYIFNETAPKKRSLLSDTSGHREYVGGVPIASLKDTQSVSSYASSYISSSSFSKSSVQDPYAPVQPVLSPIMDVNSEAYGLSRETSLNPQQPVPPIKPSVKVIGDYLMLITQGHLYLSR